MIRLMRFLLAAAVAGSLLGCAGGAVTSGAPPVARVPEVDHCRDLLRVLDARVDEAGVADAQSSRIDGFAYLRINRFLAADGVKPEVGSAECGGRPGRLAWGGGPPSSG